MSQHDLTDEEIRRITAEADAGHSPAVLAAQRQPLPSTFVEELAKMPPLPLFATGEAPAERMESPSPM